MDAYLEKLELHGFKSFPDKTVLKFHKGITAVVGPNGCGKSNIVDSLLWVLGEQRIKNLRGENNEDLIFNGSSSKQPLGMTEVGAHFVENNEQIYIARRFFRTGEGKYILNERYCRNKDIQDVLYRLRLGGRNYFIFEQGSIEKLVSLKPSEKRMLIEEAADISQYLIRKKETANKLIIAQQNLDSLQMLTADKESRLKDLRNQVNFVQRYRKLKTDKINFLKTLLIRKRNLYQGDFEQYQSMIEEMIGQETVLVKETTRLEKDIMRLEEKRWLIDKELKEKQQNIFDFNKKILSARGEIERSKQGRNFKSQRVGDIMNAVKKNTAEIETIEKQIVETDQRTQQLEAQLNNESTGYDDLETQLAELNDRLELTHDDNASLKGDIFNIQGEMSRISNQIKNIDKRMMRIENEVETKTNFVSQLKDQVSNDEITQLESSVKTLNTRVEETGQQFSESETQFNENRKKVNELDSQYTQHSNEIRNLDNQKQKYLQIKKKLAGEAGAGAGKEIQHHGFLQDLVQADKEYHTILENFYYDEMDAILSANADELADGGVNLSKCLLKGNHIPGPTLDDAKKTDIQGQDGFTAWIKDLYTLADPRLKDYFKDGVLVDTLKNGIRIFAAHGVDIVTRDAETITRDGLMVRSREKGILDVLDEIREIDKKSLQLKERAEELKTQLDAEREKRPGLKTRMEELRTTLRKSETELMQSRSRLETLAKNRDTNMKRVKATEAEIELLNTEKDRLQDEFEKLDLTNAEMEDRFNDLSQQRERYQEEVQQIKEEINRVEKQYLQRENAVNLVKEKIASSGATLKNLRKSKVRLEHTIKENEAEMLRLRDEVQVMKKKEDTLAGGLKETDRLKDELEKTVKGRETEFADLNARIKQFNADMATRRKALEEIKDNKKEVEISLSSLKKDLFQLEDLSFKELNLELKQLETVPELMDRPVEDLEENISQLDEKLIRMRDSNRLNFSAESEYELLTRDYNFMLTQKEDVIKSIEDMNAAIEKIDTESRISFMEAYNQVNGSFKENFKILFEGGEAELLIMDENNILETGLDIKAQPPGKRLLSLNLLSGGEKTLTSLAFLFALFQYKPSPFCVFDEVDASLDEANIQRFLKFLHQLKKNTQFLIITHNFKTMEEADYIYGITMNEPGISTTYSMKMTEARGRFGSQA